ncbi:MAG: hypothetical protein ACFB21_14575 [Opitutales bacterium]
MSFHNVLQLAAGLLVFSLAQAQNADPESGRMSFEDIQLEEPLPSELGLYFPLSDPPAPPADMPSAAEREAMAERGEPYFNPQPVTLNVRFIDNRFAVIFLNPEGLVTKPPEIFEITVDAERLNSDSERFQFALRLSPDSVYYFHPRIIRPPLRYGIRLIVDRPAPGADPNADESDARTTIYGYQVLNQLAQRNEIEAEDGEN